MYKPKSVDDWAISDEAKKVVRRELKKWLTLLISQNKGYTGNVFRYNFLIPDFYYFTNCKELVHKDPEFKANETNRAVRRRKEYVLLQLLIKQIMDGPYKRQLFCSHCGHPEEIKHGFNGHYKFCPHCKKVVLVGYLPTMLESLDYVLTHEDKPLIEELKQFKYKPKVKLCQKNQPKT